MVTAVRNAPAPLASRMLVDLAPGEALDFKGAGIRLEVIGKSGRCARLRITAPRSLKIEREPLAGVDTSMAG